MFALWLGIAAATLQCVLHDFSFFLWTRHAMCIHNINTHTRGLMLVSVWSIWDILSCMMSQITMLCLFSTHSTVTYIKSGNEYMLYFCRAPANDTLNKRLWHSDSVNCFVYIFQVELFDFLFPWNMRLIIFSTASTTFFFLHILNFHILFQKLMFNTSPLLLKCV